MSIDFRPTAEPVARLIDELQRLPGIGPKSAQRLAYYLLQVDKDQARALAEALITVKEEVSLCPICLNITDSDMCSICRNPRRDVSKICVVEKPVDILPLERTRAYSGVYHVLHGAIKPSDGVGPDELKANELMRRLDNGVVEEVILATNPNVEGEATAMYLQRMIVPLGIEVTRLARGLPFGADLEYADDVTLTRAMEGRQEFL